MSEETMSLPRLLELAGDLLVRQRDAMIHGNIAQVGQLSEVLTEVLAFLRTAASRDTVEAGEPGALRRFQDQVRLNRRLAENGLAVTDHFAASLAASLQTTSILMREQA